MCVIVCVTVCVLVCVYVPYVLFWRQNKQVWEQMCIIVCVFPVEDGGLRVGAVQRENQPLGIYSMHP